MRLCTGVILLGAVFALEGLSVARAQEQTEPDLQEEVSEQPSIFGFHLAFGLENALIPSAPGGESSVDQSLFAVNFGLSVPVVHGENNSLFLGADFDAQYPARVRLSEGQANSLASVLPVVLYRNVQDNFLLASSTAAVGVDISRIQYSSADMFYYGPFIEIGETLSAEKFVFDWFSPKIGASGRWYIPGGRYRSESEVAVTQSNGTLALQTVRFSSRGALNGWALQVRLAQQSANTKLDFGIQGDWQALNFEDLRVVKDTKEQKTTIGMKRSLYSFYISRNN